MSDERDELRERLVAVTRRWERINAEKDTEIAELKKRVVYAETEVERLRAENLVLFAQVPEKTYDALKAENARLRKVVSDTLTCLDAAQESAHGICLETDKYRFGEPAYDMTWDHVWELANNILNCAANASAAVGVGDATKETTE